MDGKSRKIFFQLAPRFWIIGFIVPVVLLHFSCSPASQQKQEHPTYFDRVFDEVDSLWHIDIDTSLIHLKNAYAEFEHPGKLDLFRKYAHLQKHYLSKTPYHDLYMADLYADSMLYVINDVILQQQYPLHYARALFAKGDALRDLKQYQEAYAYFYRGREFLEQTNNACLHHEYISRLATVYYQQEKYSEAASYFIESLQQLAKCDSTDFTIFYLQQGLLDNVALSYEQTGNIDRALFYYDSTLQFIENKGQKFLDIPEYKQLIDEAIGVVWGNKGSTLLMKGDTLDAENLFKLSIATNIRGRNNKRDAQLTMAKLAGLHLNGKRLKEANSVLEEMKISLAYTPYADIRQKWYQLKWQYYEKTAQVDSAHLALKSYTYLKDSLEAHANKPPITDINREFERITKEQQLKLLKKENELKTAYLVVLAFLFITIVLVTWLIWKHWKRSNYHVAELKRLNGEITVQHEAIRKNLSALEKSQKVNSKMMKIVAHDLRNPVGGIHALSNLLMEQLEHEKVIHYKESKEIVELIKSSSLTAINLISDLMELDTSLTSTDKELLEMDVTLKYCVDLLQVKAREKQQTIELKTEPSKVMASREKLWRVFSNLINNAIKFSPDGSKITVALKKVNDKIRVSVIDQGIGIPASLQDKIFNLSSEAKRNGTRGEESFGFGLYISKQIIEAHGGSIWFESQKGKGSVFIVEMKLSDSEDIPNGQ